MMKLHTKKKTMTLEEKKEYLRVFRGSTKLKKEKSTQKNPNTTRQQQNVLYIIYIFPFFYFKRKKNTKNRMADQKADAEI